MPRTTDEIIESMSEEQALHPELSTINSTSATAIYTLWKGVIARVQVYLEQLFDAKRDEIEAILNQSVPPSLQWFRTKAFEFQYDATIPQVMELIDLIPRYSVVDESKRIITRAGVVGVVGGSVEVRLAKNEPPEKLTSPELSAVQAYFISSGDGTNQAVGIGYGGQVVTCVSYDPDLMQLTATITYDGKYASTFPAQALAAIEGYISNVGVAATFRTNDLINAIESVDGFVDIFINELGCRSAATAFASRTKLVDADETQFTSYDVIAGYMIGETTGGSTLADTLTFTAV
jgi:hypothetical protein